MKVIPQYKVIGPYIYDRIIHKYRKKHAVKHFNTLVAQYFYPIKITTTWNAPPNEVGSSRTLNSFKNSLESRVGNVQLSGDESRVGNVQLSAGESRVDNIQLSAG